jgi:hypothetical protein
MSVKNSDHSSLAMLGQRFAIPWIGISSFDATGTNAMRSRSAFV